jgi:hypothetical protein
MGMKKRQAHLDKFADLKKSLEDRYPRPTRKALSKALSAMENHLYDESRWVSPSQILDVVAGKVNRRVDLADALRTTFSFKLVPDTPLAFAFACDTALFIQEGAATAPLYGIEYSQLTSVTVHPEGLAFGYLGDAPQGKLHGALSLVQVNQDDATRFAGTVSELSRVETSFESLPLKASQPDQESVSKRGPSVGEMPPSATEVEQIRQYAALRDEGLLTEAEFTAKKRQLLGFGPDGD